jgi:hypothetical protein
MANIGGNIRAEIQKKITETDEYGNPKRDERGVAITSWKGVCTFPGWLAMQSGDSKYTNFSAKVEESTHVFLSDFIKSVYALADENTRLVINKTVYDVLLIDNPQEMDEQLEIYLRRVGAWNG